MTQRRHCFSSRLMSVRAARSSVLITSTTSVVFGFCVAILLLLLGIITPNGSSTSPTSTNDSSDSNTHWSGTFFADAAFIDSQEDAIFQELEIGLDGQVMIPKEEQNKNHPKKESVAPPAVDQALDRPTLVPLVPELVPPDKIASQPSVKKNKPTPKLGKNYEQHQQKNLQNQQNNLPNQQRFHPKKIQQLEAKAFAEPDPKKRAQLWLQILRHDPRNGNAHVQIGLALVGGENFHKPGFSNVQDGIQLLERALDPRHVATPIPLPTPNAVWLCLLLARYRWEQKNLERAQAHWRRARRGLDVMNQQQQPQSQWTPVLPTAEMCTDASLATLLHPFPTSVQHERDMAQQHEQEMKRFLKKYGRKRRKDDNDNTNNYLSLSMNNYHSLSINTLELATHVPGAAMNDPYEQCILTHFQLSFYYSADIARLARLHKNVSRRLFELHYIAPHVQTYHANKEQQRQKRQEEAQQKRLDSSDNSNNNKKNNNNPNKNKFTKPCVTRKIQLGIASGFLSPGSSVAEDFSGVLQRLDRKRFNVTYLHFLRSADTPTDPAFLTYVATGKNKQKNQHKKPDRLWTFARDAQQHFGNATYVTQYYEQIASLQLDVLLFLDMTMNPTLDRIGGSARFAAVQATTHGHPITSGSEPYYEYGNTDVTTTAEASSNAPKIIGGTMDYFVSWGAAELPIERAQKHYTERLILLNASVPHQYYAPRYDDQGNSRMDGQPFRDKASRMWFVQQTDLFHNKNDDNRKAPPLRDSSDNLHWYTCMQKPHKLFPEMDPLLCGVLQKDPQAVLILHEPDTTEWQVILNQRLETAGCDLERIYFLPALSHSILLALYSVSTVILDSYPAGGCTTTREALELSKVVVTWPARLLGGRWSYAYYQMLGDDAVINKNVIATSASDYINKAVRLGQDATLRQKVERRIQKRLLPKLYYSQAAVKSWETVLRKMAPVQSRDKCPSSGSSSSSVFGSRVKE